MPRRKFIDKKSAQTFQLVHRAQNDPLIHDENAPSMVFAEKSTQQPRRPREQDYAHSSAGSVISSRSTFKSAKVKERGDLEEEFGLAVRKNEGEAAQHGVFFDDTEYDYMQHMRDLGSGEGGVTWVEASAEQKQGKGTGKQRLEDALRVMDLGGDVQSVGTSASQLSAARSLLPEDVLPSEFVKKTSYQDQQDVPDEIAGFQPDMDPRLREVLEALEDEAYVDEDNDDGEGFFGELTKGAGEIEREEWERLGDQEMFETGERELDFVGGDSEDGWESDDTIRVPSPPPPASRHSKVPAGEAAKPPEDALAQPPADPTEGAWLDEFKKFKQASKTALLSSAPNAAGPAPRPAAPSALESSALSSLATGRKKKRRGAKTGTSNYSMSSSALARTDQQTLLDSRFDKFEEEYAADEFPADDEEMDDSLSLASGASKASRASRYSTASGMSGISSYSRATDSEAPKLQRGDFDRIMDDFLGGSSSSAGKIGRRGKKGGAPSQNLAMRHLDELRQGLGPARVKSAAGAS